MKRPLDFIEIDSIVIDVLNDCITNNDDNNSRINNSINKLQKVGELETKIGHMVKRMTRTNFALESKPDTVKKILRVSINHTFHQATATDRSHFIVSIEGIILY